ncbi:long-chain fatty acid--CoA ligase [Gordonia sinesedis]
MRRDPLRFDDEPVKLKLMLDLVLSCGKNERKSDRESEGLPVPETTRTEPVPAPGPARASGAAGDRPPVCATVSMAVRQWAMRHPADTAVQAPGLSLTWADLDDQADRCAGWLRERGIGPGDAVAWLGRNTPEAAVIYLALRRLRAALVGLNWRLAPAELAATADAVRPRMVLTDPARAVDAAALPGRIPVWPVDGLGAWADEPRYPGVDEPGDADETAADEIAADEIALFWFTSGSTGVPKAAAIGADRLEDAVAADPGFPIADGDHLLIVPPIFHAAGSIWLHYAFSRGATAHFVEDASPAALVDALASLGITHMLTVPTMLATIVEEVERRPGVLDKLRLRHVCYGTAPMAPDLLRRGIALLGCSFTGVYGLTEAGGVVTTLRAADHEPDGPHAHRLDSVGRPMPGIEVVVRAPDGTDCAVGATGIVWVASPTMMLGYWQGGRPGTRYNSGDWCVTGDLGYIDDDGYLYVTGRADDVIITGGEKVAPVEVEGVIESMPGIAESGVYGITDPRWGQRVAAAVVPVPGAAVEASAVIAFCRERLAHYKCPGRVDIVEELPRTATGKLLRGRIGTAP